MRIILAVFFSICFLTVYIYAILLLFGIGGKALAGYHRSQNETTAGKEHKYILRRAGICLLVITMLSHAMCMFFIFGMYILGGVTVALLIIASVLSVYLLNNKKMVNKEKIVKKAVPDTEKKESE